MNICVCVIGCAECCLLFVFLFHFGMRMRMRVKMNDSKYFERCAAVGLRTKYKIELQLYNNFLFP